MTSPHHPSPVTRSQLVADLRSLGLPAGATVMVHTSLRSLGWVIGGPQTVLEALRDAVGPEGTLVMPTQSWQLCDPAMLEEAPSEWWPTIRENLPLYDPAVTPSQTMGAVAELFRTTPGALRSPHPHRSITAAGPKAAQITASHPLDSPSGETSPLGALVELDAWILLLGVTAAKVTALHLAEHRATYASKETKPNGVVMIVDGQRQWITWEDLDVHDHDFVDVAEAFAHDTGLVRTHQVGDATATLMPMRALVEYASDWFTAHRH
ncbi:aminoglycoside N(3)-acetyltransferase [Tessaracoccus caeni]|uniref:aminoglycoside N(3)-acetyltransferase n=1 Tax=Tessaracoccus caeni TaxID=3031239 RepID=UPI0023DBB935|nr:AAC(3) family N-acetyltransferase [Tessaracoccus caeni]MDF1487300.1 AAC(3) family N-acetyltransferase [Tessaracoccus caeni]